MIKYFIKSGLNFSEVDAPKVNCLINAPNANLDSVIEVAKLIKIDSTEITDSLDLMEIPRVEKINNTTCAIFTRFPNMEESGIYTSPLTMVLSEDYFVTISPSGCELVTSVINNPSDYNPSKRTQFLLHILLLIIQGYTRVIKKIRTEVVLYEKALTKVNERAITELTHKEENLNQCLNALQPLKTVIEDLLTNKYINLEEEDQDHLEDILLGAEQAEVLCELSIRIIASLRNSIQVLMTNEFNGTIKLLTALTIILNLPTTIASIYGMNVHLPFQDSKWAFEIVISFIIASFLGAFYFFQRRRWL